MAKKSASKVETKARRSTGSYAATEPRKEIIAKLEAAIVGQMNGKADIRVATLTAAKGLDPEIMIALGASPDVVNSTKATGKAAEKTAAASLAASILDAIKVARAKNVNPHVAVRMAARRSGLRSLMSV